MEEQRTKKHLAIGTILDDKYTIVQYLASGGFGHTYLATDSLNRDVVIKEFFISGVCTRDVVSQSVTISVEENKEIYNAQKTKFIKEAQRIRALSHPNIVKVFDLFEENDTAYYVMDYIEGQSLAQKSKPIAEPMVLHYLNQILMALEFVHSQGILHLDIKPSNIMIDNQNNAILIDFGASKQYDADSASQSILSTTSSLTYTLGYASFEQMSNQSKNLGTHSDMYSLGATLYNMLIGIKPPLPSDILENGIPHLSLLSPQMGRVIEYCMKISIRERIKTVKEFKSLFVGQKNVAVVQDEKTRYVQRNPKPQEVGTDRIRQQKWHKPQPPKYERPVRQNENKKKKSTNNNAMVYISALFAAIVVLITLANKKGSSSYSDTAHDTITTHVSNEIAPSFSESNSTKSTSNKSTSNKSTQSSDALFSKDGYYYYTGTFTDLEGVVKPVSLRFTSKNGKIINCVYKNEELGGKIKMTGNWTSNGFKVKGKDGPLNFTMTMRAEGSSLNSLVGDVYVGKKYLTAELAKSN